ncbi:MAG TPA: DUF2244 domain-containing protein [Xanthobacteraceae bacterium]|nr:DUF2244 domain-containing protein [Xanthobacteraceae bacterium]
MTSGNDFDGTSPADAPLFSALITPHRSLGRTGFMALMACISVISFASGLVFLMLGAWPVVFFFALDVALIFWAFRVNYRTGRATEEIIVTPTQLRVKRVSHRGDCAEWTLNPLWVRLDRSESSEFGIERLDLVSRGTRLTIASFLGADEKASFAAALSVALADAKRGPRYNHHLI